MNITVMTYNIQHGHVHLSDPGRIDLTETAAVIRDSGADIVGLNEVRGLGEHPDYTAQVEQMAAYLGFHCIFLLPVTDYRILSYSRAVFKCAIPCISRKP